MQSEIQRLLDSWASTAEALYKTTVTPGLAAVEARIYEKCRKELEEACQSK